MTLWYHGSFMDILAFKFSNTFPIHLDKKNTMAAKTCIVFFLPWDSWTAPISRSNILSETLLNNSIKWEVHTVT